MGLMPRQLRVLPALIPGEKQGRDEGERGDCGAKQMQCADPPVGESP